MDTRQRLGELQVRRRSIGLSAAEWWETASLLRQIGDHRQADLAEASARQAASAAPPPAPAPEATATAVEPQAKPSGCEVFVAVGTLVAHVLQLIGLVLMAMIFFSLMKACSG